jgi:RNA polymerase sigma-70 factor (ECF subfamily)
VTALRTRRADRQAPRGDAELLRLVAEHDIDALGELYDRYARDVWRVARRVLGGGGEDVEDLVHTLFLKLPDIARSYDGRAACRSWLCGIAVRISLRHRRSAGRFHKMLAAFAQTLSGTSRDGDPERRASDHEELARFERALRRLTAKKRAVFVLVELEGMTAEDAAVALEIPPATARTRLFHARRELHEAMRDGGAE